MLASAIGSPLFLTPTAVSHPFLTTLFFALVLLMAFLSAGFLIQHLLGTDKIGRELERIAAALELNDKALCHHCENSGDESLTD